MATLNVPLTDYEIKQLLDKYRTPEGLVDYKTFCENVEKVFFNAEEAQDALDNRHSKPV